MRDGASPRPLRRVDVARSDAQNGACEQGCAGACCRRVPGRGDGAGPGSCASEDLELCVHDAVARSDDPDADLVATVWSIDGCNSNFVR